MIRWTFGFAIIGVLRHEGDIASFIGDGKLPAETSNDYTHKAGAHVQWLMYRD